MALNFGISPALVTPFDQKGVDVQRLAGHALDCLERGCRTATVFGTTGEGPSVGALERERVASALVDLGFTPLEALRAATTVAADLIGLGDKTGALTTGLEGDVIVVERNPLEDIRALADVLVVVSNGRVALNRLPFGRARTE